MNPLDVPTAEKVDAAGRLDRPAAAGRSGRPRLRVRAAGPGEQVLRGPGGHDDHPAADPHPPGVRGDGRRRRHLRLDGEHRAARRPRLGVPHRPGRAGGYDWDEELDQVPELLAEKLKAPSIEAGRYDLVIHPSQPVAHHPRVDRPRDRARPGAGLRGQLRRHLVRDVRQAQHPAVRLTGHERDRRPDRRARAGHRRATTTRASRPSRGTSSRTASWSATSSTGRWAT